LVQNELESDAVNSFDHNLRVDRITIDGIEYQTEEPDVLPAGTWQPNGIGLVPGSISSKFLQAITFSPAGTELGTVHS
jgi:hypothetical protein